jgi:hypothetical protein
MTNASFLVGPGTAVELPVSCVESGRWRYESPRFESPGRAVSTRVRGSSITRLAASIERGAGYDLDQAAVWDEVGHYLRRTRTRSSTSSYSDGASRAAAIAEDVLARVRPAPDWTGLAVLAGGDITAIEVLGSPRLFARAWRKIVIGAVVDAYPGGGTAADPGERGRAALEAITRTPVVRRAGLGLGETLHGSGDWSVGAVVDGGRLYHLFAAPGGL